MSNAPIPFDTGGPERAAGSVVARMYEQHARPLFGLCRMLLRDTSEAEDALQSTFLSAYRALLRGDEPRDASAWLATIARNECRTRIRHRMREPVGSPPEVLEGIADQRPSPVERIGDDTVRKALAALPEKQREAVVLHDLFGLRSREVGVALGLSVTAVEASLFRARRQLRTRLRSTTASVMVVPVGIQETLSGLIPGFATGTAAIGGSTVLGAGLFAKVVGLPGAVKVAAGVAALATAGSVVAVESGSTPPDPPALARSGPSANSVAEQPLASNPAGSDRAESQVESGRSSGRQEDEKDELDDSSSGQGSSGSPHDTTDNEGSRSSGDEAEEGTADDSSGQGGAPSNGVADDGGGGSGSGSGARSGPDSRDDEETDEPIEAEGERDDSGSARSGSQDPREDESSSGGSGPSTASGDSGGDAVPDVESGSDPEASREDDPDSSGRGPGSDGEGSEDD